MLICYVDESGCTGQLPDAASLIQPAFCMVGLAIDQSKIRQLTFDFLQLKRRFFPGRLPPTAGNLSWVLVEIKGSDLRTAIRNGTHKEKRHAIGFIDAAFRLIERAEASIFGKVFVKAIGAPINSTSIYTRSLQCVCDTFQNLLELRQTTGFVIADSRNKPKNTVAAHSIFTQKFRAIGDGYPALLEMVTFGHSDNHIGLQLADLICSSIIFPLTMHSYCVGHITSTHVSNEYQVLRARFCQRLKARQHRHWDNRDSRFRGGLVVSDGLGHRDGSHLFRV